MPHPAAPKVPEPQPLPLAIVGVQMSLRFLETGSVTRPISTLFGLTTLAIEPYAKRFVALSAAQGDSPRFRSH
jgi:hypothetical protein